MTRYLFPLSFVGVIISSVASLGASGGAQSGIEAKRGGVITAPSGDRQPFKNLFPSPLQPRPDTEPRIPRFQFQQAPAGPTSGARLVCGMTVIPIDPRFDQAIRRSVPETAPRSAIRAMPAPACEYQKAPSPSPQQR